MSSIAKAPRITDHSLFYPVNASIDLIPGIILCRLGESY